MIFRRPRVRDQARLNGRISICASKRHSTLVPPRSDSYDENDEQNAAYPLPRTERNATMKLGVFMMPSHPPERDFYAGHQ